MIEDSDGVPGSPKRLTQLKKEKAAMMHEFGLLGTRKSMASYEIREIDNKIANLHGMRRIILERLAGLEQDEAMLEHDSMCPANQCPRSSMLTLQFPRWRCG